MLDRNALTFADVGCGTGSLSAELCRQGLTGLGVDSSADAVAIAQVTLEKQIANHRYRLICADVRDITAEKVDVAVSMMVAEHVEDDASFVSSVAALVRPGGQVIIGVPGRRDRWGFEDEISGHLRRYERTDLDALLRAANLERVTVWSVAVPVANLLFHIGNYLVRRSTSHSIRSQSNDEQTASSGIREVPWKTVFPRWCAILLNRWTLYPLLVLQRFFYRSAAGVTLLGSGRVPMSLPVKEL